MKIELLKSQNIELSKLETNKGQIEGLPKNPRHIKSEKYDKLKKSIEDNPEMLGMREVLVYPHGSKYVIIGGNMRFQACKELQFVTIPCKILDKDMTAEQLRAITIKDNVGFGEHDWELLANEWDSVELEEWGLDLLNENESSENEKENGEIKFSTELDQESNYIVLKFTKDIDFIYIESILGLESTFSKRANGKPWSKGIGRVVDGVDAILKFKESQ